jgi:protein SCO1/2
MNKTALFGILLALVLPVGIYLFMKNKSREVTAMPRHYIADSIVAHKKDGKDVYDTVWHKIPDFTLTNQLGNDVSWKDLEGKIVVANFFFTQCPTICPHMTINMKRLQEAIHSASKVGNREAKFLQFLSFSIDPERDSVERLKNWANRFQINPQNWWLLTGPRKEIYDLSIDHFKLTAIDGAHIDSQFVHTDYFVLIDKNRNIRGYYHSLKPDMTPDIASLSQLSRDVIFLSLEKDPNKKSVFAGKLELILIVFCAVILGMVLFFSFLKREKRSL